MSGRWLEVGGVVPAATSGQLRRRLAGETRGEGSLEVELDHYEPVRGPMPRRHRTGADPLNRKEYLLEVLAKVPRPADGTTP